MRLGLLLPFVLAGWAAAAAPAPGSIKACVYFEGSPERSSNGRLHAIMLANLLGHFREVAVDRIEIAGYRGGDLDACDRAAYMGSDYGTPLPQAFLKDVAAYKKPFLWLNYGIERLQTSLGEDAFARRTGFNFLDNRGSDPAAPGAIPGFYRYFDYKGQRFTKVAALDADGSLIGAPEIMMIKPAGARTLSTATHSSTGETTPYVLEHDGFFYVADNPFVYINPQDRYLILTDVLFDYLRLPPRETARHALVRLEDIHPEYDLKLLYRTIDLLKKKHVPFAISLIPKYVAPGQDEGKGIELTERPAFMKALRYAQDNGGELLLHGYTHDVAGTAACAALGSGSGYEFWDRCAQVPLTQDSSEFARGRVVSAKQLLVKAGLSAIAWVTPHYAASPDDYKVFGLYFDRVVQRVCYLIAGRKAGEAPVYISQFFPYTIYKDHYGQFVWPEDLGFVPMPGSNWGYDSPGDIPAAARGLTVVRDSWASFFWHPQLMAKPGEAERLSAIIDSLRASGYVFVSLKTLRDRGE
jgi:uncharacterized protein YdaL